MRLIDADAFEKSVMFGDAEDMQDVIYALREYPTAYDPDKVVEQLDKASDYYEFDEQGMEHVQMLRLVDAIEIVKGGGVDAQANP